MVFNIYILLACVGALVAAVSGGEQWLLTIGVLLVFFGGYLDGIFSERRGDWKP